MRTYVVHYSVNETKRWERVKAKTRKEAKHRLENRVLTRDGRMIEVLWVS
jgi:hypothetical protein